MSARRTELEVTVRIGEITVPGGRLQIPAQLDFGGSRPSGGGGGGGGSRGGGGGGGSRGGGSGSGGGGTELDTNAMAGVAANMAGVFQQFGLRRQLFALQGLLRGVSKEATISAASLARVEAAQAALVVANQRRIAADVQATAAKAHLAEVENLAALGMLDGAAAADALAIADQGVAITSQEAAAAVAAQAVAEEGLAAANGAATVTTTGLAAALWAMLAPLLPIIAALLAIVAAVYAVYKAYQVMIEVLKVVEKVVLKALAAMRDLAIWLGEKFKEFAEVVLRKTIETLWEFGRVVVDVTERGVEQVQKFVENAVSYFADFEQAVTSTVAVMGIFGDGAEAVRQRVAGMANSMSEASRFSGLELAQSMQEVAKAGYETEAALEQVTNAGRILAEATLEQVTPSTELLVKTLNQYGLEADQAMRVTNLMAAAANKSLASVASLGKALEYAGPTAHMFGIGIEETAAALMGMFNQGAKGSMAGTQLTNMFNSLLKQTDKATKLFKNVGFDLATLDPTRMGIIEIIKTLEQLQARIGQANLQKLIGGAFEIRAMRGFNMLLSVGSKQLEQMQKSITGTNDALLMQAEQMQTLQGGWLMLVNLWKTVETEVVGGGFGNALSGTIHLLRMLVDVAKSAGVFSRFSAVLMQATFVVRDMIGALGGPLIEAISDVIDLLPAAVTKIGTTLQGLAPQIAAFVGKLPGIIGGAIDKILPALLKFVETVVPLLIDFATMALPLMVDIFSKFVEVVTAFLSENGDKLVGWFEAVLTAALGLVMMLPQLLPVLAGIVSAVVELGPQLLFTALNAIPALIQAATDLLPTLRAVADQGVVLLEYMMDFLAQSMQSGILPIMQTYLGMLVQVGQFIMANWPVITQILTNGLALVSALLNMGGGSVARFGGYIVWLLNMLRDNWPAVVKTVAGSVASLIGGLKSLISWIVALQPQVRIVIGIFTALGSVLLTIVNIMVTLTSLIGTVVLSIAQLAVGQLPEALQTWASFFKNIGDMWSNIPAFGTVMTGLAAASQAVTVGGPIANDALDATTRNLRELGSGAGTAPLPPAAANGSSGAQGGERTASAPSGDFNVWVDGKIAAKVALSDLINGGIQSDRLAGNTDGMVSFGYGRV